jgi:hypothetical protein
MTSQGRPSGAARLSYYTTSARADSILAGGSRDSEAVPCPHLCPELGYSGAPQRN